MRHGAVLLANIESMVFAMFDHYIGIHWIEDCCHPMYPLIYSYMLPKPMIRYQHKDANKKFQRSMHGACFKPQLHLKKALAPSDASFQVHHLTIPEALDLHLSTPQTKARA